MKTIDPCSGPEVMLVLQPRETEAGSEACPGSRQRGSSYWIWDTIRERLSGLVPGTTVRTIRSKPGVNLKQELILDAQAQIQPRQRRMDALIRRCSPPRPVEGSPPQADPKEGPQGRGHLRRRPACVPSQRGGCGQVRLCTGGRLSHPRAGHLSREGEPKYLCAASSRYSARSLRVRSAKIWAAAEGHLFGEMCQGPHGPDEPARSRASDPRMERDDENAGPTSDEDAVDVCRRCRQVS